jgi:hypothetical protein
MKGHALLGRQQYKWYLLSICKMPQPTRIAIRVLLHWVRLCAILSSNELYYLSCPNISVLLMCRI